MDSACRWFCIGGGPSLTADDVHAAQGHGRTIAINDAWRLAPWADVLYACDGRWWDHHHEPVAAGFPGRKITQDEDAAKAYGIELIRSVDQPGLSPVPGKIHRGHNSGYQAINLALLMGAKEIILLGYDMQATDKTHWFGDHPAPLQVKSPFDLFISKFETIKPEDYGIRIINCSRQTALTCFEDMSLESVLSTAPGQA